ncbi:MAG TPA: CoA pyrophosphatase [Nitrososphaeraceae archaeon]|jgi:8-oxo-dGTP pyrophosphatase MutT (NUDIX family)
MPNFVQIREILKETLNIYSLSNRQACLAKNKKNAAVLVIIHCYANTPNILLTKRSGTLYNHPSQVSFPGGNFCPNDLTPLSTAIRETNEEIGINIPSEYIIGSLQVVQTTTSNYDIYPFVAMVEKLTKPRPNEEVQKIFSIPINVLETMVYNNRINEGHADEQDLRIKWQDMIIWGATARIIKQLLNYLR